MVLQGGNHVVTIPAGSAQQAQIIQTSDGQALVYPIQVDSQGNIIQQQPTGKRGDGTQHGLDTLFVIMVDALYSM